jgi:hypothetical protein
VAEPGAGRGADVCDGDFPRKTVQKKHSSQKPQKGQKKRRQAKGNADAADCGHSGWG